MRSQQRYRHLFENVPICIFVVDLAVSPAVILEANRRAELVYGYMPAELIGLPVTHLVSENARPTVLSIVQRIQQGETVTTETISLRRDSTRFSARVIAAPDPTDDGLMFVTVEDITAEKQRRSEAEAIDAERHRIAREIHDGVAQSLAGLRFKSALWAHLAETAPPGMRAALDELLDVLTAAIVDLRRAIYALRPLDLEALGFFSALTQMVGDFGDQYQVVTRLEVTSENDTLPAIYELPLYRIIQEGLNNIGQHAHARSALVCLTIDATGGVGVSVQDDGCGFDPQQLSPIDRDGHWGLRQMRERILDLRGTLDVFSGLGQGTELIVTLPPADQGTNHVAR